jgi:16S rRNA G966 N2-methylase RsmD
MNNNNEITNNIKNDNNNISRNMQLSYNNSYEEDKKNDQFKNTMMRLFPELNDNNLLFKLKTDEVGKYSISLPKTAKIISTIIYHHILKLNLLNDKITITDATAGIGGNTISFAKTFNKVNSIEINKERFLYLENNIKVYELDNVITINDNYIKIMNNLKQDVVFIDPPWGGRNYKKKKKLKIELSNICLSELCNSIKNNAKLIVLKVPLNYDLNSLIESINANIYKYRIKKMFILIIEF